MTERWRRAALISVLGLVGPLVLYYGLRALGRSVFLACVIGALVPVVGLVGGLLRDGVRTLGRGSGASCWRWPCR